MKKWIQALLITTLLMMSGEALAQHNLEIASAFQRYGKGKGATLVELSNELLEGYEMKLYKSLTLRTPSAEAQKYILRCLENDKKKAKKIKEMVTDGQLISGFYHLPQEQEDVNRFILYKDSKKKLTTLIYIEGELEADDLVTLLFIKKS